MPDIPRPPGDEWSIRTAADTIRGTVADLQSAKTAAVRLEAICDGAHWQGEAFEVFRASVERKPLPEAVDHASATMEHAAGALETFAARFATNCCTVDWCRSRLRALGLAPGLEVPDELVGEVQRIAHDADQAWDDHRAALRVLADTFDWLDDQPTFAQPPPSTFERVSGVAGDVLGFAGDIVVGFGEAVWELGKLGVQLGLLLNPVTAPFMIQKIWDARDQIVAVLQYAWEHPGDFALLLGKAFVDHETWTEDGIGRWIGHRIPDIILTLATGGLGRVGSGAATVVRLAHRLDASSELAARLRQLPGAVNDGIKRVTQLPIPNMPSAVQHHVDSFLTGGLTSRLAVLDGLLVGAPALSPQTRAAMVGVLGVEVLDRMTTPARVIADTHAASTAGCP